MTVALKFDQELVTEDCYTCGMVFAMPAGWRARRLNDHASFFCPAGHSQRYIGETTEERLRKQLDEQTRIATQQAERAAQAEHTVEAERKKARGLARRAKAGLCPCCNRTFVALARHMETKHPEHGKP